MINKELKHLSRRELVDIIYQLKKNEQGLQEEIESLKNELQDKRIRIATAGSLADAAISVTNMLSAAQTTADIYLREISCMKTETEKECEKKIEDANHKAKEILAEGERRLNFLKAAYKNEHEKWQQLRTQNAALEAAKSESCKDREND